MLEPLCIPMSGRTRVMGQNGSRAKGEVSGTFSLKGKYVVAA